MLKVWHVPLLKLSKVDVPTTPGAVGHLWAPVPACREVGSMAPWEGLAGALGLLARWSSKYDTINSKQTIVRTDTHKHHRSYYALVVLRWFTIK